MPRKSLHKPPPEGVVRRYLANRDALIYTPFRINPDGTGGYIVKGKMYSRAEFEKAHPLPVSLVTGLRPNSDGTKKWMN